MKKQTILIALSVVLFSLAALIVTGRFDPAQSRFQLESKKKGGKPSFDKEQGALDAAEWRHSKMVDENGNFSPNYIRNAMLQADRSKVSASRSNLNMQWEELGPDNVGGRTRAILIDKRDPSNKTIYAGGVSGGMWKSLDGGNTWNILPEWNRWLTVTCIAQANDFNKAIFIGTGEGLAQPSGISFNSGNIGNGIFKLDNEDKPTLITPDNFADSIQYIGDDWTLVNRIAINPRDANQMAAATGKGLFQSDDAGVSWYASVLPAALVGKPAADVKWGNDGTIIFASVGATSNGFGAGASLVVSQNGGFSWRLIVNNRHGFPPKQGRIEIAIAPSNPNIAYVSVAGSAGATYQVLRTENTSDTGIVWKVIGAKGPLFDPMGENSQGWYDNVIAVSPADPNRVYHGGVDFYTWSDLSGWKQIDFGYITEVNPRYIHPDKHAITIADNDPNLMFVGSDGGISRSLDAYSSFPFPNFSVKNRGYNVTQFYSVAAALSGEVMGGTQDNGTPYINYLGNTRKASRMVSGGDGIYTEISHLDPRMFFAGVYYGQIRRSGNYGASFDGFYDLKVDRTGKGCPSRCGAQECVGNAPFITPFYLSETKNAGHGLATTTFKADRAYSTGEEVTAISRTAEYKFTTTLTADLAPGQEIQVNDPIRSRAFVSSYCGVWLTSEALELGGIPKWHKLTNSTSGVVNAYAATKDANTLYVGSANGFVYRFGNLNAHCDTATYPIGDNAWTVLYPTNPNVTNDYTSSASPVAANRSVEGVAVDPNDENHVVAVVSGFSATNLPHVYESFNGGKNWTALTKDLPNMPVYDVVVHDANTIIIGTEMGIWSWDGSGWHEENNVLPRVPVFRLIEKNLYQDGCPVLYIGTHGRGIWRSTSLTPGGCNLVAGVENVKAPEISDLNIFPNPANASSKVSISLENSTPVTLRIFDMTGKLHKEDTYTNTKSGGNTFDLNAAGLSSGTYILSATVANTRTQSRLFVISK
ncbi:MAG: T9SS type A sorting domain-containing protein [Bacteroidetes bacterium]|nr:T9SS type A sorting domain-containing protein [Bacteroidota bacterium]